MHYVCYTRVQQHFGITSNWICSWSRSSRSFSSSYSWS